VIVNAYLLAPGRPPADLLPASAATVETWPGALAGVGLLDDGDGSAVRGLPSTGDVALALGDAVETAAVRFLSESELAEFDADAE
jgi:hypothetical protein